MIQSDDINGNLAAFLEMIKWSEIGAALIAVSDEGFNVLVGSTPRRPLLFTDYSTHPDVYNSLLNSTAAGAFQIIYPTWKSLCLRLGVNDFGKSTQRLMAASLVEVDCQALGMVLSGDLVNAVQACSGEWASLPGSDSGQFQNKMDALAQAYTGAGGTLTA